MGQNMSKIYIPPHMIPTKDKRQDSGWQPEPLYAPLPWDPTAGQQSRTPVTNIDGREIPGDTGRRERPAYNPDVPRWD